jgi:hypothetical protein
MAGYTGKLATKYVVQHCSTDLKWAIAGRSHAKLVALADEARQLNVNRKAVGIVLADADDLEALSSLARSTKVVVSFAGPFSKLSVVIQQLTLDLEPNSFKRALRTGLIMQTLPERLLGTSQRSQLIGGSAKSF